MPDYSPDDSSKPPLGLLSILTFSVINLELLLTCFFGYICYYHFTAAAISTALLGLGLGAFFRLRYLVGVRVDRIFTFGYLALVGGLPAIYLTLWLVPSPVFLVLTSLVVFSVAGALISQYYDLHRAQSAYRTYFFDLAGAALACALFPPLIAWLGAVKLIAFLSLLSAASLLILFHDRQFSSWVPVVVVGLLANLLLVRCPDALLKAIKKSDKPLSSRLHESGGVIDTAWSAVGRSDLYQEPAYKNLKWIYNDGMASTILLGQLKERSQEQLLRNLFPYFPLTVRHPETALFLGPGAGLEVQLARLANVRAMSAVELNPAIIRLVRAWKEFSGPVYDRPDIQLIVDEGRKYVVSHPQRFDFIQMANVGTGAAQSGSLAMIEGFLFTKEAVQSYLEHLTADGLMTVFDDSPLRILRQFLTDATVICRQQKVEEQSALQRLCVFEDVASRATQYRFLIMMSKSPLTEAETLEIFERSKNLGYRALWVPGRASEEPYREIPRLGLGKFIRQFPYDVSPCADDKPFYFNHFKAAEDIFRLGWPFFGISIAAFLGFIIIAKDSSRSKAIGRSSVVALLLGMGFMFLELGLLQKLALIAGGPAQTLSVLLFALLLYCGLGSLMAAKRKGIPVSVFCFAAAGIAVLTILWLHRFYRLPNVSSTPVRILIALIAIGPLGLMLGMPFPSILRTIPNDDRFGLARLWGANGFGSVIGSCAFMYISLLLGIQNSMFIGASVYLMASLVSR